MTGNEITLILAAVLMSGFWLMINLFAGATWLKFISIIGVLFFAALATIKVAQALL